MQGPLILNGELSVDEVLSMQGELWRISLEASIAAGTSYYVGMTCAANVMIHTISLRTGADRMRLYLHENVSYTGGTNRIPLSKNRQLNKAATSVWQLGVTASPGTPPGGGLLFGNKSGGSYDFDENFILKKNTPYVFQIVNDANSQTDIAFVALDFGELVLPT